LKIGQYLREKGFSLSFEFFPPKTPEGEQELFQTIKELEALKPTFVSVTYGAGGSTRDRTRRVVERIHKETNITVMAHLTCIAHTKEEIYQIVQEYKSIGIENLLALRGDVPANMPDFRPPDGACKHAEELVRFIRESFGDWFSIGVASYPEGHPESPNMEWELRFFKRKVLAGADFSITQMFFENQYYYSFLEMCQKWDINIPIIPGIMPITNLRQVQKFASMCGTEIPQALIDKLSAYEDKPEDFIKVSVEHTAKQCLDLLDNHVPGLHFYTLNKSKATLMVYELIREKLPS